MALYKYAYYDYDYDYYCNFRAKKVEGQDPKKFPALCAERVPLHFQIYSDATGCSDSKNWKLTAEIIKKQLWYFLL